MIVNMRDKFGLLLALVASIFILNFKFASSKVEEICECRDVIDSVGYGNCTVEYEGEVGCYVIDEPNKKESNCTDLTESEKGQYSISEGCRNRAKANPQIEKAKKMCNPDFTDDDGIRKKIFACQNYTALEWCTSDGKQGEKWNEVKYGNLANYTNKFGESPMVCPQCGCGRVPKRCNPSWMDLDNNTCSYYKENDYCKPSGDHKGSAWEKEWGELKDFLNTKNQSALVCPECGCKEGLIKVERPRNASLVANVQFTIRTWLVFENVTKKNFTKKSSLKAELHRIIADVLCVPKTSIPPEMFKIFGNPFGPQKTAYPEIVVTVIAMDQENAKRIKNVINTIDFKKNINKEIEASKTLKKKKIKLRATTKASVETATVKSCRKMSDCGELEKCCTDVSCEQACMGQAPLDSQRYCSRVCKVQRTRCECENGAVEPDLNALPIYHCPDHLQCEQGGNCTVRWKGERVCGSVGTVVMTCMKHFLAAAPKECEAGEKDCICS